MPVSRYDDIPLQPNACTNKTRHAATMNIAPLILPLPRHINATREQMNSTDLMCVWVGVVAERHKAATERLGTIWRPSSAFVGQLSMTPWTRIGGPAGRELYFVGNGVLELRKAAMANYVANLATSVPALWVVCRFETPRTRARKNLSIVLPPIVSVTADPAERKTFVGPRYGISGAINLPPVMTAIVRDFLRRHNAEGLDSQQLSAA